MSADALKAEGNKAFAAKQFDEAVYVELEVVLCPTTDALLAQSSEKPLSSNPQITSYIQTDLEPMPR